LPLYPGQASFEG